MTIVEIRDSLQLSPTMFAQLLGVSTSTVHRWESGPSVHIEPMQQKLLALIERQIAAGNANQLGFEIKGAISVRGALYGLYRLLEAEFGA